MAADLLVALALPEYRMRLHKTRMDHRGIQTPAAETEY